MKVHLKLVSGDLASELIDSILVSVNAEDPARVTAGVIWMAEGNVVSDEGPMSVPEALHLGQTLADEQGKDTVYITIQPDGFQWLPEWGKLDDVEPS